MKEEKCSYYKNGKICETKPTYSADTVFGKHYYCLKHKNIRIESMCCKNFKKLIK